MFNKKLKRITSIALLTGLFCMSFPKCIANAQNISSEMISIQSVNVSNVALYLGISRSVADISVSICGVGGTSKIAADVTLQRYEQSTKKWKKVRVWEKTVKSMVLTYGEKYQLYNHGTYRFKVVATATRNGVGETITKYSNIREY